MAKPALLWTLWVATNREGGTQLVRVEPRRSWEGNRGPVLPERRISLHGFHVENDSLAIMFPVYPPPKYGVNRAELALRADSALRERRGSTSLNARVGRIQTWRTQGGLTMRSKRGRRVWATLVVLLLLQGTAGRALKAQQAKKDGAPPAATGKTNAPAEPEKVEGESFLRWMARSSGPIGVVILLMSFYLVALVVWMFLRFRPEVAAPPGLAEELTDLLMNRQYERAFARVEEDRSFLAYTLSAGVRRLPSGTAAAQRAMELANEERTMEMEHRTTYLATVGTLGPMIGLVGTVYGMIRAFQVIATMGASPQASQLASGISTALFATLLGIAISVPAIAFYAYFRNRIARLSLEVQIIAEGLLDLFAPGVRAIHPVVAPGGAPPLPSRAALPPRPE